MKVRNGSCMELSRAEVYMNWSCLVAVFKVISFQLQEKLKDQFRDCLVSCQMLLFIFQSICLFTKGCRESC